MKKENPEIQNYGDIMSRYGTAIYHSELKHHGILGQKWGVRRYQNEDGSLTPEGKQHYSIYKNYKQSAKKFNTMSNQLNKQRAYLKDENFMNAYKKVGDEFEGYLKNNKDSLKIGKKIDKKYGKSPKDVNEFILKNKSTSILKSNKNVEKSMNSFKKSSDYKYWKNAKLNDKKAQQIAATYLYDFAGAKLRDMHLDDSSESRFYLANKPYFQESVPHINGYLESFNYKLLNHVDPDIKK